MIYIRADGNGKIGMGHVMRCIAIGKEIMSRGCKVTFVLAGEEAAAKVAEEGFSVQVLGTDYTDMEAEWELLDKVLPIGGKVLVDSYFVTEQYLRRLSARRTVIYLDDMNFFPYPVDCVINGNIYGGDMDYQAPLVLGGCKYAPLRREYREAKGSGKPEYILITTGSSDPYSITKQLLTELVKRPTLLAKQFRVICGKFNQDYPKLKEMEQKYPNIQVLQNIGDMWNEMSGALAAITAGGTTMNELSCMGVPMVCFSFVDNQERITATYKEKGYVHYCGDYLQEGAAMITELCDALEELVSDEKLLAQYREKLADLVDGWGSSRIAEAIIGLPGKKVEI